MEKNNNKNKKLDKKDLITSNTKNKSNNDSEINDYSDFNYIYEKPNLSIHKMSKNAYFNCYCYSIGRIIDSIKAISSTPRPYFL